MHDDTLFQEKPHPHAPLPLFHQLLPQSAAYPSLLWNPSALYRNSYQHGSLLYKFRCILPVPALPPYFQVCAMELFSSIFSVSSADFPAAVLLSVPVIVFLSVPASEPLVSLSLPPLFLTGLKSPVHSYRHLHLI